MKRVILFILFIVGASSALFAQTKKVRGNVIDTSAAKFIENASIVLLNAKDSMIVASVRTEQNGSFRFEKLSDSIDYLLFVSFPDYISYTTRLDWSKAVADQLTLETIQLLSKGKFLEEVIVKARKPIVRMKGDTTVYDVENIEMRPNATVEDLLKELPGLQVDQKGNITAQGKSVQQVFVDGEEYFSDDPKLVTRNLRSDMIAKVQVYDKKTDQENLTGIDDGNVQQVINLQLKDDKKSGVFGKLMAGIGTNNHYVGQGMINFFQPKYKMAAFFSGNNIGDAGIGTNDTEMISVDDEVVMEVSARGIPEKKSGGLHYNTAWNEDKSKINGKYDFSFGNNKNSENSFSRNNLESGIIDKTEANNILTRNNRQSIKATYNQKLDTMMNTLVVSVSGFYGNNQSNTNYQSSDRNEAGGLLNKNRREEATTGNSNGYNLNVALSTRLKKSSLMFNFVNGHDLASGKGINSSTTAFYNGKPDADSITSLDFNTTTKRTSNSLSFSSTLIKSFKRKVGLNIEYKSSYVKALEDNRSYTTSPGIKPELDNNYSSNRGNTNWGNGASVGIGYYHNKASVSLKNGILFSTLSLNNKITNTSFKRNFVTWQPTASFNYAINRFKSGIIRYTGGHRLPGLEQMLPDTYKNDQLTTFLPNDDLKKSFAHNLFGAYTSFRTLAARYFSVMADYSVSTNPIVQSVVIAPTGATTYQWQNLFGYTSSNYSLRSFFSMKSEWLNTQLTFDLSTYGGAGFNSTNGDISKLIYNSIDAGLSGYKTKQELYIIGLGGKVGYVSNKITYIQQTDNNYFTFELKPSVELTLVKKVKFKTDLNYSWKQKTEAFMDDLQQAVWNAWISKPFMKEDAIVVRISCNDILNQNRGYDRTTSATLFKESNFSNIQRFFMISAIWNFNKFKAAK